MNKPDPAQMSNFFDRNSTSIPAMAITMATSEVYARAAE